MSPSNMFVTQISNNMIDPSRASMMSFKYRVSPLKMREPRKIEVDEKPETPVHGIARLSSVPLK